MVDRFLVWVGTGVLTAGVSAAVVAGAGVAAATDGASSDGDGSKTSESSDNAGSKTESGAGQTSPNSPNSPGDKQGPDAKDDGAGDAKDADKKDDDAKDDAKDDDAKDDDAKDGDATTEDATLDGVTGADTTDTTDTTDATETNEGAVELVDPADGTGTGSGSNDIHTDDPQTLRFDPAAVDDLGPAAKIEAEDGEQKNAVFVDTEGEPGEDLEVVPLATTFEDVTEQAETTEFATMSLQSPAAVPVTATITANPLNILLDVIGTIVFGLYGFVIQLFGGPPMLPPGSSVTVRSSTLRIDCGCAPGAGEQVPADWYIPNVPEGAPPPDRLIYLQHGFLAAGPWYSYTAAALAEQTNSIVVAPSITSNFLDFGQCWLGGAPMHQAMADLFADGNTALAESALAAGYSGAIPDRVVLMGHSLGGGAVSGIAGYMTENGSADRLAGVVLLDGVGLNGQMTNDLKKVPTDIPIYQLAAPRYMWNTFGSGTDSLVAARPDADFYGVTLVGGSHVDSMRGGNWLIQFSQQLVAGFSKPQNVAAASMLMVGWVNDMFDGDRADGIYLDRGETFALNTPAGTATLVDLPNSLRRPYILNFLEPFMALSGGLFTLQPGCLREPTGTAASCTASVAA
jgi:acetyl esterase/lipase